MKSEERAKEKYPETVSAVDYWTYARECYIDGARDQKEIDIEKACIWLMQNFYREETMVDCIAYCKDCSLGEMIEHFREAMSEN